MKVSPTPIAGVHVIDAEKIADERGFFARSYCVDELAAAGLIGGAVQGSISFNTRKGTLRGMHFQAAPHEETKIVRCTRGAIVDVALDLRPGSPTFKQWFAAELTADNHRSLYIPPGCAHGFQTLVDASEVTYLITPRWVPAAGRTVRWNDPAFGIRWPLPDPILSAKDRDAPDFPA